MTKLRWHRPGVADVLFLLVALSVFRGAQHTLLDDPGLGWHVRNIDAMLAEGGWLTSDPFTDPRGQPPAQWYSNQWLGELPYWLGWKWAGLEGIAAVNALGIAVMAGLLYRMQLADGLAWPVALVWTALGVMGTSCSWNARPNVFTILFVLVTARACMRLHEGKLPLRTGLGLVVLFAVWANTHGGFVAGLILLAATLAIEAALAVAANDPAARAAARRRLWQGGLLGAGAALATGCNPYGFALYGWVFKLLGDPYFMTLHQEWRSPDFLSAGAMRYEILFLLFPAVLALSARRPNLVELSLSVLWLHFALAGFRYVALWVVVAVPLMARSSVEVPGLREFARRLGLTADEGSLFHTPAGRVGWVWSAVLGVVVLLGAKALEGRFAVHKQEIIASRALDRFLALVREWQEEHGRPAALYHDYRWGGYLTWHGWPEVRNWIDDRNEVQGKGHIQEHLQVENAEPGWEGPLARIDLVCIDGKAPLARQLERMSGQWQERYRDEHAIIFERRADP
jgi:hypothetical protein